VVRRWIVTLMLFAAAAARANDLSVDPRSLQLNDLTTITVSLEGEFAKLDSVNVPVQNLGIVGQPWVSSEFAWINGEVIRRKVFRYRARPLLPGPAQVGPLILTAADGQRDTLPAIALQISRDRTVTTNDPEVLLRELVATGRPPLFVVAEADKTNAWMGEQVLITWWLYNAATVENWQIVSVPKLAEFWAEEIDARNVDPERVFVGDRTMMRAPLRRVALYPLRSGSLPIGGMTLEASVMERTRSGPFAVFEGTLVETTFSSAPLTIHVRALPEGPPVAAVGEVSLNCDLPKQKNGGPVVIEATLNGAANLRSAAPPKFVGALAGTVQVEGGETRVEREEGLISMTRRWRYLIFPAKGGMLEIPAMAMTVFSPATGARRELTCEATTFWNAEVAWTAKPAEPRAPAAETPRTDRKWPWVAGGAALFALLLVPRVIREVALRHDVHDIVQGSAAEIRERIDARMKTAPAVLLIEQSDRGDAYRALRSLLDAAERERDIAEDAEREIARRVRELLQFAS
jgi:hypothetical protein